ncbi:zinc finger protein 888-like [Aedes aegypti]|uniref:C2H2-type domain-containing protein n=1 Tax=Aedes aegypti TaxID=7159 RepID=A0A903VNT5_AEDAE|nr:zinc finger protein 888-like [Aedes aegypti]
MDPLNLAPTLPNAPGARPVPSKAPNWVCNVCKKRFPSKSKLTAHNGVTPRNRLINTLVDKCDRVFRTAANLAKHKQFHGGEKFSCDHCRKVYATSSMLKTHKLSHSNDRPHRCTICDQDVQTESGFERRYVSNLV